MTAEACNWDKNMTPGWLFALRRCWDFEVRECVQPSFPAKSHGNRAGFPSEPERHGS